MILGIYLPIFKILYMIYLQYWSLKNKVAIALWGLIYARLLHIWIISFKPEIYYSCITNEA